MLNPTDYGSLREFFDVEFVFPQLTCDEDPVSIKAHKDVLANRCEVFADIFYGNAEAATTVEGLQIVHVDDITPDIFGFFIHCMYAPDTKRFRITDENVEGLLYTAEKYRFQVLRQKSKDYMFRRLCSLNCVHFWAIAKKHQLVELEAKASEMAKTSVDIVFGHHSRDYADVDMWIDVLSSKGFSCHDFKNVITNAIQWAMRSEGGQDALLCDIRKTLKPLEPLLQQHLIKYSIPSHILYSVFFPNFKCAPIAYTVEVKARDRSGSIWSAVQFTPCKSALLVKATNSSNGYSIQGYQTDDDPWIWLSPGVQTKIFCKKDVRYTLMFATFDPTYGDPSGAYFRCRGSNSRPSADKNCNSYCRCRKHTWNVFEICCQSSPLIPSNNGTLGLFIHGCSVSANLIFES